MAILAEHGKSRTIIVDTDPTTGGGYDYPIGWQAKYTVTGATYQKTGAGATAWVDQGTGGTSSPFFMGTTLSTRRVSNFSCSSLTTGTFPIDDLRVFKFVHEPKIYNRIDIEVTTAVAGQNLYVCIYKDNNGVPGDRFYQGGPISAATIGVKTLTPTLNMVDQEYWLGGICSNSSVNMRNFNTINGYGLYGYDDTGTSQYQFFRRATTFGVPPDPFPSGGNLQAGGMMMVWLKE